MADQAWVDGKKWFHAIDFGNGVSSAGRFSEDVPPNYTLYGVFDFLKDIRLDGMSCLDIGTMDGLTAFILKSRGAETVTATDMAETETFAMGRELLGLDIDYRTPYRIDQLPELFDVKRFDLVVNAGILYHVFDPLQSLIDCRLLLKSNGLMILETQYAFDERGPVMIFNPGDETGRSNPHANTFWKPSRKTVEAMAELAGFEILGTRAINGRLTLLCRATQPSSLRTHRKAVKHIHRTYMKYRNYGEKVDFGALDRPGTESRIAYSGEPGGAFIFRSRFTSTLPFQPCWNPDARTRRKAFVTDLRFWIGTKLRHPDL